MPQSEFMLCCIVTLGILCCSFLSVGALNFNLCTYSMCKTYINFTTFLNLLQTIFYDHCVSVATVPSNLCFDEGRDKVEVRQRRGRVVWRRRADCGRWLVGRHQIKISSKWMHSNTSTWKRLFNMRI